MRGGPPRPLAREHIVAPPENAPYPAGDVVRPGGVLIISIAADRRLTCPPSVGEGDRLCGPGRVLTSRHEAEREAVDFRHPVTPLKGENRGVDRIMETVSR